MNYVDIFQLLFFGLLLWLLVRGLMELFIIRKMPKKEPRDCDASYPEPLDEQDIVNNGPCDIVAIKDVIGEETDWSKGKFTAVHSSASVKQFSNEYLWDGSGYVVDNDAFDSVRECFYCCQLNNLDDTTYCQFCGAPLSISRK